MLSPDQVASQGPGGFLNLNGGPTDPYYARADGTAYASAAEACAAVPVPARKNRTVNVAGLEYWWLAPNLSDAGLVAKGTTATGGDTITAVALSAQNVLTITTDKGPKTVDLSALAVKGDTITAINLVGSVLRLVTDGGTYSVDLSSLQTSTGTAPVAGDTVSSLSLTSATNLRLVTDKGTFNVDLGTFTGKGDTISAFSLSGDTLTLSTDLGTRTVDLSAYATKTFVGQQVAGLATTAYVDTAAAAAKQRANHTGQQPASTISDFTEAVQDAVASLLGAGSNITLTYDDASNSFTIAAASTAFDPEATRDAIGAALIGVGLVSVVINDAADTITVSTTATRNSPDAQLRDRTTHTGQQPASTISDFVEAAQDAVGNAVADTQTVNLTYNDATGALTADLSYSDSAEIDLSQDANGLQAQLTPAVRARLTALEAQAPTVAQKAALDAASSPSATNPLVTKADLAGLGSGGSGGGSTPFDLPTMTASGDGPQAFALPTGTSYVNDLMVTEGGAPPHGGRTRKLGRADYTRSGDTLSLTASADIKDQDKIDGTYFIAAATGSSPSGSTGGDPSTLPYTLA